MPSEVIHRGLTVWDYLVVVLFALGMLAVGMYYSRRQTNLNEYFLGGRRMNWAIVGISTMATLVSTISYLTTPGEIIANGFGVLWAMVSIVIAFFVIGYLMIPKIMQHNIVSGYQLLERQFGMGIRRAAAVLFIFTRIAWVGLVVYTCSVALSAMTGWPLASILIGVGAITTIYTVMGGIRGVMTTDVIQAGILFFGAVAVVLFAINHSGGFTGWWPNLGSPEVKEALRWKQVPLFSASMTVRITILGMILHQMMWWILTASSDQLAIQRYLSTRDVRAARKSFLANGIANTMVGTVLALVGIALLGYFLNNPEVIPPMKELVPGASPKALAQMASDTAGMSALQQNVYVLTHAADKVFPWFIARILPAGLSGLLVAALFSAAMSSVSSGINSITTILMVDFERTFIKPADDAGKVAKARLIGIATGVVTTAVSFLLQYVRGNFMDVAQKVNLFFVAPLGALFFMAFFIKRTNKQGASASIFAGFLVGVFVAYYSEIHQLLTGERIISTFTYTLAFAFAASLIAGYFVSLAFPAPGGGKAVAATSTAAEEHQESEVHA